MEQQQHMNTYYQVGSVSNFDQQNDNYVNYRIVTNTQQQQNQNQHQQQQMMLNPETMYSTNSTMYEINQMVEQAPPIIPAPMMPAYQQQSENYGTSDASDDTNQHYLTPQTSTMQLQNLGIVYCDHVGEDQLAPPFGMPMIQQQQQPLQQQPLQQQQQQQILYQQQPAQQVYFSDSPACSSNHASPSAMQSSPSISVEWLDNVCRQLIDHMNSYGICVIDNFLGSICGEAILSEVYSLYNNGLFRKGQLVNNRLVDGRTHIVRGDSIIWVDGSEKCCKQIELLIETLDSVIINCNKMSGNNGEFDRHIINQRTKAMIACYPGNGTHYIKHIDNPNGDGRCITSIYYLNKDWDIQRDGGLLRIFPVGIDEVANIAPLFDRVLFFWSDRRNPHEVQPSQRIRFAITVWFIDSNEKQRKQQQQQLLQRRYQAQQHPQQIQNQQCQNELYNFNY